jgi:hypothetical protein
MNSRYSWVCLIRDSARFGDFVDFLLGMAYPRDKYIIPRVSLESIGRIGGIVDLKSTVDLRLEFFPRLPDPIGFTVQGHRSSRYRATLDFSRDLLVAIFFCPEGSTVQVLCSLIFGFQ